MTTPDRMTVFSSLYPQLVEIAANSDNPHADDWLAEAGLFLWTAPLPLALSDCTNAANNALRRMERRKTSSLDTSEDYGHYHAIEGKSLTWKDRENDNRKNGQRATPMQPKKGMAELEEESLDFLLTVIRNLQDRGVMNGGDPLTFAVDVRSLPHDLRRAVVWQLCLCTRQERKEAGLGWRTAERWLESYAAYRCDQA